MKKNGKYIINNHSYNLTLNHNNFKMTPKNRIQQTSKNSSNYLKGKVRKIDVKSKNKTNLNFNTISSSVPYQRILDELMKYLEVKIRPTLYKEVNNYLNTKINNYLIDNIDKNYIKKIKVDLNKDKILKKNNDINTFSSKKYKSYLNFNASDKNKKNISKNNYIYSQIHNFNQSNSVKKDKISKKNLLSKLMLSTDYLQKKIDVLGKHKKNDYCLTCNNCKRHPSQTSFENYYKGSSENIKNFSYENKSKKNNDFNNEINSINKRLKNFKKDNLKLSKKNIEKIRYKNNKEKLVNKKLNNASKSKSKSKDKFKSKEKYKLNLNISSQNKNKIFSFNNQINKLNKIKNNNSYINTEYINNNTNNNIQNKKITINVNLTQRPFMNKINFLNQKLINKLKLSMNKNNKTSNSIEKKTKKLYNLKNYAIFTKLVKNNNKGFMNKNNNKVNFYNIKKAKSYRINNSKIKKKSNLSLKKKSKEKKNIENNININKKLDKNNFLKIVNNITNKKNINDKKYIHIDSIEINNIIKSTNEKDEKKKESKNIDNKNGSFKCQNNNVTNEELMKKIKNSLDDNLKVMLNFSYENFLSKESERD